MIAYNARTPDRTLPYITRDQYRSSPNVMDTQNLIRGGAQTDQDKELDRIILQASAWCDNAAEQPLTAQQTTESMRMPVSPDGRLRLHPRQHPIVSVSDVRFGPDPMYLSALTDLSGVWVEDQQVIAPLQSSFTSTWSGPMQFGTARPGSRVYVQMTYVAGFPVTTLTGAVLTTDTTITVADVTGLRPGLQVRLLQGGAPTGAGSAQTALSQAQVIIQSVDAVSRVVTLTGTVGTAFAVGAAVTAMPEEVEQACIFVTTALLKQRGAGGLVMGSHSATSAQRKDGPDLPGVEEFDEAEAILAVYRPVI